MKSKFVKGGNYAGAGNFLKFGAVAMRGYGA